MFFFHDREVQKRISPKSIFPLESTILRIFIAHFWGLRAHFSQGPAVGCKGGITLTAIIPSGGSKAEGNTRIGESVPYGANSTLRA